MEHDTVHSSIGKFLAKPSVYNGDEASWHEWAFTFKRFVRSALPGIGEAMDAAERQTEPIDFSTLQAEVRELAVGLMSLLSSYTKDRALATIRNTLQEDNGLEAWRRLAFMMDDGAPLRLKAQLRAIVKHEFRGDFRNALLQWELMVKTYERHGASIPDEIKLAVVTEGAPARLREIYKSTPTGTRRMRRHARQ